MISKNNENFSTGVTYGNNFPELIWERVVTPPLIGVSNNSLTSVNILR